MNWKTTVAQSVHSSKGSCLAVITETKRRKKPVCRVYSTWLQQVWPSSKTQRKWSQNLQCLRFLRKILNFLGNLVKICHFPIRMQPFLLEYETKHLKISLKYWFFYATCRKPYFHKKKKNTHTHEQLCQTNVGQHWEHLCVFDMQTYFSNVVLSLQ